jgi:hypothetical protein
LAERAESMGVEIYPGFAGKEVLYDWNGAVVGVATGACDVGRKGRNLVCMLGGWWGAHGSYCQAGC